MTTFIQNNLKLLGICDLLFLVFLIFQIIKNKSVIGQFIHWSFTYFVSTIQLQLNRKHVFLIIVGMSTLIYFSIYFPLGIDESYTFLHFTKEGFYNSLFTYPVPNNHVFYSLCTNVVYPMVQLFGNAQCTRILSLLTILIFLLFFVAFLNRNMGFYRSVSFLLCFFFIPPFLDYSYQVRGYVFFIILGILNAVVTFKYAQHRYFYPIFFLLNFIGLITSPAWLYSFFSFGMVVFLSSTWTKFHLKRFVFWSLVLFFSVLLFYSPIIIFYGIDTITNNPYVRAVEQFTYLLTLKKLYTILLLATNQEQWLAFLLIVVLFISIVGSKKWRYLIVPISMIILMIILKQEPFERIFVGILSYTLVYILFYFPLLPKLRLNNILLLALFIASNVFMVYYMKSKYLSIDTKLSKFQILLEQRVDENEVGEFYLSKSDLLLNNYLCSYQWPEKKVNFKLYTCVDSAWKHFTEDSLQRNAIFIHAPKYSRWVDSTQLSFTNYPFERVGSYTFMMRQK